MTIRAWRKPQATPGNDYKLGASERITVSAVDAIAISEIRPRDAKASGFESTDTLVSMLTKESGRRLTARSKVFRVRFRYAGTVKDEPPAFTRDELDARLDRMGEWSRTLLALIGANPGVSSAVLAKQMGRERMKLKADVRKLKRLGLTQSLDVGYRLTKQGKSVVR